MHNKRITVFSWIVALLSVGIALGLLAYFLLPRSHKSPLDFPNSVWECEYNGATITLVVGDNRRDRRGYIEKYGERIYLAVSFDTIIGLVIMDTITEEEFYGDLQPLSSLQTILIADFRCTSKRFTVQSGILEDREMAFWQTEGPIELVFYRVIE